MRAKIATATPEVARVELKSLVQAHPKSGEARLLLGTRLLDDGDGTAAAAEFQRALEFGVAESKALPLHAEALLLAGEFARLTQTYASTKLPDAAGQARLQAAVAWAEVALGNLDAARAANASALAASPTSPEALLMKARLAITGNGIGDALAIVDQVLAADPNRADAWMLKGDLQQRQPEGRAAANASFMKAIEAAPNLVQPRLALMSLNVAQGDLAAARAQVEELRKRAPKNVNTGIAEAQVAFLSGDSAKAREIFQEVLRVLPDHVGVLLAAGENELTLGSAQQAEAHFAKASALAPRNQVARRLLAKAQLRLGQTPRALVTLGPLLDLPDVGPEVLALAAKARALNGETQAAQALYDRLAKLKPADPRLRTLVATAGFGRTDDMQVFKALRSIANDDKGNTADLALINAHLSRGQTDAALAALAALQRKLPQDPMPSHMRGQVLANTGKLADARQSLEAALALQPGFFPSLAALALLDIKEGKADLARQRFETVIKAQPRNATAMLMLAEVLERQKAPAKQVRAQLDAAIKAAPGDVAARLALVNHLLTAGDLEAALNAAQAANSALPDNIELLGVLADCQLRASQASQALTTHGKIASLQPKSPQGHLGMAEVYVSGKQFDMAQRSLDKALELSPGLASARRLAVRVALGRGQPAEAIAITRQMQADHPGDAGGFVLEGEVQMRQRQWAAAAAVLRKALDKPPAGPASALLYRALARSDRPADATQFATQRLAAKPQDTALLLELANTAQQRNELDAAQRYYERLLALQPDHLPALNNLAMLHLTRKQPGALAIARRAASLAPRQSAILDTLAQAQAAEGSVVDAIATLRDAVGQAPDQPEYRLSLARLLVRNGDRADALPHLKRLAALGSGFSAHAEVDELLKRLGPAVR